MSIVNTTPYRPPVVKPPIEAPNFPLFGLGRMAPEEYTNDALMAQVFGTVHENPVENPQFFLPQVDYETYYYYLAPVEYGAVTFRNASGLAGGWDGASWPLDDMGEEFGPVEVVYEGITWNLYRTDWGGAQAGNYTVSFANA